MNKLLLILLLSIPIIGLGQKSKKEPVTLPEKNGQIFYERIASVDSSFSRDDLYDRSLRWLAKMFVDSKEVIQVENKDRGNILGKGSFDVVTNSFFGYASRIQFIIDITLKDGKYRFQVYQFQQKLINNPHARGDFYPMERGWSIYKEGKSFSPKDDYRLYAGLNAKVTSLIDDFHTEITSKPSDDF